MAYGYATGTIKAFKAGTTTSRKRQSEATLAHGILRTAKFHMLHLRTGSGLKLAVGGYGIRLREACIVIALPKISSTKWLKLALVKNHQVGRKIPVLQKIRSSEIYGQQTQAVTRSKTLQRPYSTFLGTQAGLCSGKADVQLVGLQIN